LDSILNNEFLFYYDVISDGCDGHTISLTEFVDKALFFTSNCVSYKHSSQLDGNSKSI